LFWGFYAGVRVKTQRHNDQREQEEPKLTDKNVVQAENIKISCIKKRGSRQTRYLTWARSMENKKDRNLRAKCHANLHQGAKPSTYEHAKELRRQSTKAEKILWSLLRNRQFKGKKFRRQHAIARYVADFYCHESKLIIELDGYHHAGKKAKEYDELRTKVLAEMGITVIRFWNEEIINSPEKVLRKISNYL